MKDFAKKTLKELTIAAAICSFIGLLAPLYWAFDLFNHFRPHAVLACFLLLIAQIYMSRKMVLLAGLVLIGNVILLGYGVYQSSPLPESKGAENLKIISANVLSSNKNYHSFVSLIDEQSPDIIVVTEINDEWVSGLEGLQEQYRYRYLQPRPDNFGIGIYSKTPFKADFFDAGDKYDTPLLVGDFEDFKVIAAHSLPPMSADYARDNGLYLSKLAEIVRDSTVPVIVAGDLNSTLWSQTMKPLFDAGLQSVNRKGFAYTWPVGVFPLAIQIDHILTKGISAGNFKVLSDIGSDHYPVGADLVLPKDN